MDNELLEFKLIIIINNNSNNQSKLKSWEQISNNWMKKLFNVYFYS